MRDKDKTSIIERFMLFLELLTYVKSVNVNEYELFDGRKLFDIDKFNADCTIALGYINNQAIIKGKFLALLENLSYEFSQAVNSKADFTLIPEIWEGKVPVSDFISIGENIQEKKVNYIFTGASGDKHIWQGKEFFHFGKEQILDILQGPDISEDTRMMYEYVMNNLSKVKQRFKQEIFVFKEILRFEFDKTSEGAIAKYLKERVFPESQALQTNSTGDENPGF
jgi:hypothetical protein